MQQRYYDPQSGQFISTDPLSPDGNSGASFNRYAYANDNPYRFTDPDGRNACGGKDDSTCNVTITFSDRSKDKNGNYNDNFTKTQNQSHYNATATVAVNGKKVGEFLARTTPSDSKKYATLANGTYSATLTSHGGALAIRLQPTNDLPTVGPNPSRSDDASRASGILIHRSGIGNFTGTTRSGSPVSAGCQLVCRSQYTSFEHATGITPDAGPPQAHFSVAVDTDENQP